MIDSFKQNVWDFFNAEYYDSLSFLDKNPRLYLDLTQGLYDDIKNSDRLLNDFKWLLFLESLGSLHLKILNLNYNLSKQIKAALNFHVDFPSKESFDRVFQNKIFSFLSFEHKNNIADLLIGFSKVSLEYQSGDLVEIWENEPENWVIMITQKMPEFNKDLRLSWSLAKIITKLGYYCTFSIFTARAFFNYTGINLNKADNFYIKWVDNLSNIKKSDRYLLELVGDLCFFDSGFSFSNDLSKLSNLKIKQQFSISKTKERILYNQEELISDDDLIDFLYTSRSSAYQVKAEDKKNLFSSLRTGFYPLSDYDGKHDWASFWRGVDMFFRRWGNFNTTEDIAVVLDTPMKVDSWFRSVMPRRYQESLWCVLLDNKNSLLDFYEVSRGTVNQTIAHPREVFAPAIERRSSSIILVHNHPSGHPTPSNNDVDTTERMRESGKLLGIALLDHLIIGKKKSYSFNEGVFNSQTAI